MDKHKRLRSFIVALIFSFASVALLLFHVLDPIDTFLEVQVYPTVGELKELKELYLVFIYWTLLFLEIYFMFRFTFEFSCILFSIESLLEVACILFLRQKGYRFPLAPILLLSYAAFLILIMYHFIVDRHRKKVVMGEIKKYISPDIADSLVRKEKESLITQKREICVFYVDIRGFTKMAEDLDAEYVVDILNRYLDMATSNIVSHGGMVDKYIGDAVMAIWNAPKDQEDFIFEAVLAAMDIKTKGEALSREIKKEYNKDLKFGIGIHVGEAVVGSVGCDNRYEYTAVGDTVNIAFRLQSNAKGGQILVSKAVRDALGKRIKATSLGHKLFKNKKKETACYVVKEILSYEKPINDTEAE